LAIKGLPYSINQTCILLNSYLKGYNILFFYYGFVLKGLQIATRQIFWGLLEKLMTATRADYFSKLLFFENERIPKLVNIFQNILKQSGQ
jgi:hypothetical protein